MSQTLQNNMLTGDWYEIACSALEELRRDVKEYAEDDDVIPPDALFQAARSFFDALRNSGVPVISAPEVWSSQDGEIGVSWSEKDENLAKRLDVLFVSATQLAATLRMHGKQQKGTNNAEAIELLRNFAA